MPTEKVREFWDKTRAELDEVEINASLEAVEDADCNTPPRSCPAASSVGAMTWRSASNDAMAPEDPPPTCGRRCAK